MKGNLAMKKKSRERFMFTGIPPGRFAVAGNKGNANYAIGDICDDVFGVKPAIDNMLMALKRARKEDHQRAREYGSYRQGDFPAPRSALLARVLDQCLAAGFAR